MRRILLLTMLLTLAVASVTNAATITILNNDGAGEGFNDPTPAAPVGGNPGVTLGQQRLNVFQYAASIWGSLLPSSVTIIVRAQFDPQTCNATQAVLGSAGATEVFANFPGAPLANTWYAVSLANRLAGADLSPANYDINATFNSNLNGQASCLGGIGWYLGYDGLEGSNIELLPVVLHEIGHGLGFATYVNRTTGAEVGPPTYPDRFERYIRDNALGLTWDNMTAAQRVTSAVSNNIVWDGPCVTTHSPEFLGPAWMMLVNAGGPLPPKIEMNAATFGPQAFSVTGNLVLVDDGAAPITDACTPLVNGAAVNGNIALLDRGVCTFNVKALAAQNAGAIAVVIANNAANPLVPGGVDPSVVIPVVGVSLADGNSLKAALLNGPVNVTLGQDFTRLAGADATNRVKLYAPTPLVSGSSTSHWDVSTFPNLLMEPAINGNLSSSVDLTLNQMIDMGWLPDCENPVAVAISAFDAMVTGSAVTLRAKFLSTLDDAKFVVVYRANGDSESFSGIKTLDAPSNGDFMFVDATVLPGHSYSYKIGVVDSEGEYLSQTAGVDVPTARVELSQNSPNPFNPTTTIRFSLPASERVGLAIYAANGSLVRTLVNGVTEPGTHNVTWDGRDTAGNPVSSGLYFYRLTAGKFSESRKMVLLK
jgi:PA domain/FlgD Ig-like domain